ncbi:MAG TPA: WYL domain-containing protein [Opitutus sp.]|nr:WYL domain-containing protein [Opitutus sp.]
MVRIHERLGHEGRITAESVAREFEVDVRTIKRDIEFMRDRLGVSIVWDRRERSYYCTHHHPLLPLLRIDADEALALALASKTFAAWRGSPLGQALTAALEKIAPILGGAVSLPVDALKDLLFAPDDPAVDAEHRYFAGLLEAIHRDREMRLVYQKPRANSSPETRIVHPLHLAYLDHRWMLVAHDLARNARRNFLLARIQDLRATGGCFTPPPRDELGRSLAGALGRFVGEKEHDVRLLVDREIAPYFRERPWHPSQQILERADGSISVSFRLNHLIDVERRILACGGHIEVLAPSELRRRIRAAATSMLARYRE